MINKDIFLFKKDTEAVATNRGFYYQYLLTLNYWLDIFLSDSDTKIFCELEDDIYEFDEKHKQQTFTQVKAYSEGFSLKSPEIKKTLLNFFMLFLQYKDDFDGHFMFYTNAGTKINAGKYLKNWEKNQEDRLHVQQHFCTETREVLRDLINFERIKKQKKIKDKDKIDKITIAYEKLEKYLYSDLFKEFIVKIRWTFLDIPTKSAIDIINTEILDKIQKLPKYGEIKKLLFARLLSEVYVKSTKDKEDERRLDKELIKVILKETKVEIETKIHKSIELLKSSNFKILDEIDKVKEIVLKSHEIIKNEFGEKFSLENFLINYSRNAIEHLSRVSFIGLQIPRGLQQSHHISLDTIYVNPIFQKFKAKKRDNENDYLVSNEKKISFERILNNDNHVVILGNAGIGKSLLVKSLICKILQKDEQLENKETYHRLPFRIELRKYLANKKENNDNIVRYLKRELEDTYYIPKITFKQVELLINTYPTLFFFDGLDEIFDLSNKDEVRSNIEQFTRTFPNVRSIVTSRIDGYEEAKMCNDFTELRILDFSSNQIKEYLNKWYSYYLPGEENEKSRENEIIAFFEEIEQESVDVELIRNPLLLSLIVILYSNLKTIPQSKYQIYESCTNTLVEKWDKTKKIKIDIEPELLKYKATILSDLAFWEYGQLSTKEGKLLLTHTNAIDKVSSAILRLDLTDDYSIAKKWSEDFLEYAQKRSIYFDNEFTHKTFREFYTAFWIFTNYERKHKIDKLNKIIAKYIDNPFWFIVLELLISMIDEKQADNDIIENLLDIQIADSKSLPFIIEILPKLKHISKKKKNEIIQISLKTSIQIADINIAGIRHQDELPLYSKIFMSIQKLYFTSQIFATIIEEEFHKIYPSFKDNEILLNKYLSFYYELYRGSYRLRIRRDKRFELQVNQTINNNIAKYYNTYYLSLLSGEKKIQIDDCINIVRTFGKDIIFKSISNIFQPMRLMPIIEHLKYLLWNSPELFISKLTELKKLNVDLLKICKYRGARYRITHQNLNNQIKVFLEIEDDNIKAVWLSYLISSSNIPEIKEAIYLVENEIGKDLAELIKYLIIDNDSSKNKLDYIFDYLKVKTPNNV